MEDKTWKQSLGSRLFVQLSTTVTRLRLLYICILSKQNWKLEVLHHPVEVKVWPVYNLNF